MEQQPWPGTTIYGFTVVTRYTNPTRDPIYLWNCFPDSRPPMYSVVAAGRRTPEGIAYNAPRACVGHDRPIRVDPGASRVDTLQLRGPNGFDGATNEPIDPIVEGRFQLRFLAQRCRTGGDCPIRDESLTLSNEFEVRTAR